MRKKIAVSARCFSCALCLLFVFFTGCMNKKTALAHEQTENEKPDNYLSIALNILNDVRFPQKESEEIKEAIAKSPSFIEEVAAIIKSDPYLWILVDRNNSLSSDYAPEDLAEITSGAFVTVVSWRSLNLRKIASDSLNEMARAAKNEGLSLAIYSAYRSHAYQIEVFARNVREMGAERAEQLSARPGHSQHQLGLTVDFHSQGEFHRTAENAWLLKNASRFGWSLSYPHGYEEVTGYAWESWHYRYVGKDLAKFIDDYFGGIQQYALFFLKEFSESLSSSLESVH